MDLIRGLRRWALARPHVLIIDAPGMDRLRWAVEAELDRRGWPLALAPADADLLLVLGMPGRNLSAAIDQIWQQIPQPRLLLRVPDEARLGPELATAADALVDAAEASDPAVAQVMPETASTTDPVDGDMGHAGMDRGSGHEGMDRGSGHEGMDHGSGHEGMDHGSGHEGMDHGSGHEGMDHGSGHDMHHARSVAGLPMAGTGPDRDGLQLDVLTVALGPVLVGWPTGLLVQAELQGDVIVDAEASWVDGPVIAVAERQPDPRRVALDHLARFLLLAGWPTAARDARRARDGLGAGHLEAVAAADKAAARLTRRVARSRTFAWSVRGLGTVAESSTGAEVGDVLDRVRRWCAVAAGQDGAVDRIPALPVEELPGLLEGVELAAARLIVASLALERTPASAHKEARHG